MENVIKTNPEKTAIFMDVFMNRYDVTIPDIATQLGVSEKQVYDWKNGKDGFTKEELLSMMKLMQTDKKFPIMFKT